MLEGAASNALSRSNPDRDCSPIILAREQPFGIGEAAFRPATREVQFRGQTSIVEPRVMQLLIALRRAGGGVVSKDDLAATCWEGRIVGEDAINRVISRLRAVSEKQAGGQFRIETITKVGYRLVPRNGAADAPTLPTAIHASGHRVGRRELIIGGGASALAAAGGIGWLSLRTDGTPREARLLIDSARKSLREGDVNDPDNSIGTLRSAVELAPNSAEAWGLLALAYVTSAVDSTAQDRPDLQARAAAAMNRAFVLEPDQGDALAAQIKSTPMYRNWYACENAARAALQHHSTHPELLLQLATILTEVGRLEEALQLYDRILPSMPLSADVLTTRAFILLSLGRLEEADAAIGKAFGLLPRNLNIWTAKATYLMFTGHAAEAAAMFGDKASRPPNISDLSYDLNLMQANAISSGDPKRIQTALQALVHASEEGNGGIIAGALFASFVGDLDQAFRLLNAFFFNRGFKVPDIYFNRSGTSFGGERHTAFLFARPLRSARRDPRFAALTREIGLDDYWTRSSSRGRVVA